MKEWRYLSFRYYDAFENMAIDEAIVRESQRTNFSPTLRFYSWEKPAVSLGYFQNVEDEVNIKFCQDMGIPIVRRPTGGKAVLHEGDLTYSVVAREDNPLFPAGLLGTYQIISRCIATGLAKLGIRADMLKEGRQAGAPELDALCFSIPSQYELLVKGKKICGSAQMRTKGVFLQHGSLLMDFDPHSSCLAISKNNGPTSREEEKLKQHVTSIHENMSRKTDHIEVCRALASGFEESLGIRLIEGSLTPGEEKTTELLLQHKYSKGKWNMEGKAIEWTLQE
ncbi:MAG: lipoate--protein ligase family protein [Deltaproteobacteria bacterium]|nr:lipoate--protein ligase family protein [Deltaproteobacteria bacterium]